MRIIKRKVKPDKVERIYLIASGGIGKSTVLGICEEALKKAGYAILSRIPHTLRVTKEWQSNG